MKSPAIAPVHARRGFTLVELLVVLVLLGLTAALATIALRAPAVPAADELSRVVATARSTAMRRAEVLELRIDAAGLWSVRPEGSAEGAVLSRGRLTAAAPALRLRIDALGSCVPRSPGTWDATQCRGGSGP